ncbi:MAG: WecB/TagA/CpsF family glycosyltransferase [Candidatus Thiodiazotropha endolucinida]
MYKEENILDKTNKYDSVLGMNINTITLDQTLYLIREWSISGLSKYICVSNVHMCMEVHDDAEFRNVVNSSDLTIPDGKPLTVALKILGNKEAYHIRGADLTRAILEISNQNSLVIGLYGGTNTAICKISDHVNKKYPNVKIGCSISPPYREITHEEDRKYIEMINNSGVQILLVGLGCPKQEVWMANHKDNIGAVMIGVGAVFDFLSGQKKEAPPIFQKLGLEWFFRLVSEPDRLWKRYAYHNPRFIWHFIKQLLTKS